MKRMRYNPDLNTIKYSSTEGEVAIWWYTDNRKFWSYSKPLDKAITCGIYLQASNSQNHLTLWKDMINNYATSEEKEKYSKLPYESIERGRVVYNTQTMNFEVICSNALLNDSTFRNDCINYFHLNATRVDFIESSHYVKFEPTGNPEIDNFYLNHEV